MSSDKAAASTGSSYFQNTEQTIHNNTWLDVANTGMNACSVESLSISSGKHTIAVGCYNLNEGSQDKSSSLPETATRNGQVLLYHVSDEHLELNKINRTVLDCEGGGILDMKWITKNYEEIFLACACSNGSIQLYSYSSSDDNESPLITIGHTDPPLVENSSTDTICTSISQNNSRNMIAGSYTNGTVAVFDSSTLQYIRVIENAHSYGPRMPAEVWTCCVSPETPDLIISGGDDCTMKGWDLRNNNNKPVFKVGSAEYENGGVTSLSFSHLKDQKNQFLSGSYDECLRLWDIRNVSKPLLRQKINVGGGIWRIKYHPAVENTALVGAMHGGCCVVNFGDVKRNDFSDCNIRAEMDITCTFTEHKSMAYGADWLQNTANTKCERESMIAASCSFYDQKIFLWNTAQNSPR
mmetsp:Transcript_38779/g.46743  ORF Transcript_38779/g.46743 Transcript_38779/m.46743 type:complete len:410 (-) Transcript_38779:87-1316(-)